MKLKLPDASKWESRELGVGDDSDIVAPSEITERLDKATKTKAISIRLPIQLIEQLKLIAKIQGVSYQPMARDVLERFAVSEMQMLVEQFIKEREEAERNKEAA
jgi:predicted DNA binding CopG/RHH family protein